LIFLLNGLVFSDNAQTALEPEHITGEWVRIRFVPSDIPGLYRNDTIVYQIGLNKLSDYMKFVESSITNPLTFKIIYYSGGLQYGYLHDPENDYDWSSGISSLNYKLELGLPENTKQSKVTFLIPEFSLPDTLCITIDSETFGLKRWRHQK
jgi:hypothetical protein